MKFLVSTTTTTAFTFLLYNKHVNVANGQQDINMTTWWPQGTPFPDETSSENGTISFYWSPGFAHNVYIHPSGDCNETDAIFLGDAFPVEYTFTADDVGKVITFACDVGEHCENGQIVQVTVLAEGETNPPTPAPSDDDGDDDGIIEMSTWWPQGQPFPDESGKVGDKVIFSWSEGFDHNVYIHPSGDCNQEGSIFVGDTSPVEYVLTQNDIGSITFACQIAGHCDNGQIVTVKVAGDDAAEPTDPPTTADPPATGAPTLVPASSPSPTSDALAYFKLWFSALLAGFATVLVV